MRLGNDTSHDGRADNFARNRGLAVMQPFVEKGAGAFFDSLRAAAIGSGPAVRLEGSALGLHIGVEKRLGLVGVLADEEEQVAALHHGAGVLHLG